MPTSRKARRLRKGEEFSVAALQRLLVPPSRSGAAYMHWSIEAIVTARSAQLAGQFYQPAQLAIAMRTDDALFAAYQNRLAPQKGLPVKLEPANDSDAAKRVAGEAEASYGEKGVHIARGALPSINGDLANHGIAIGHNVPVPRDDGSRVDLEHHHWPLEHVRWDAAERVLKTRPDGAAEEETIVHGNGRWTIYCSHENAPWTQEAAVLPGALIWADKAYGRRDRSAASKSIGNVKVVGALPEGVPLQVLNEDGTMSVSPDAAAFQTLLVELADTEQSAGVKPAGSEIDILTNQATSAWQVFNDIIRGGEVSAAKIYLGTDALSGTQSAGPGTDAARLWGIRQDIVESDLGTIERCFHEGVMQVWCAINFGDSALAPYRCYEMPDPDEEARLEALGTRTKLFFDALAGIRANGLEITQEKLDELADAYDVARLALPEETAEQAPTIALAPADLARIVTVNEARASAGLGPLLLAGGGEDPDGRLTLERYAAKQAEAYVPKPEAAPPAPAPQPEAPAAN